MLERNATPENVYHARIDVQPAADRIVDLNDLPPAKRKIAEFLLGKAETLEEFDFGEIIKACHISPKTAERLISETLEYLKENFGLKMLSVAQEYEGGGYHVLTKEFSEPSSRKRRIIETVSELGWDWDDEESVYGNVLRNIDKIPAKYHELLLLLNLSSHCTLWLTEEDIVEQTGKSKREISEQLRKLEKFLDQINITIAKIQGDSSTHIILIHRSEDEDEIYIALEQQTGIELESSEAEEPGQLDFTQLITGIRERFSKVEIFDVAISLAEAADGEKAMLSANDIAEFTALEVDFVLSALNSKTGEIPRLLRTLKIRVKKEQLSYRDNEDVYFIEVA